MKLLTTTIRAQLIRNGRLREDFMNEHCEPDFMPIVKLFTPDSNCTWLLTELDPDDHDLAFGLCDLGMGCPELGNVLISELESVRGPLGLPVERDLHFAAMKTLSSYAALARQHGRIVA